MRLGVHRGYVDRGVPLVRVGMGVLRPTGLHADMLPRASLIAAARVLEIVHFSTGWCNRDGSPTRPR
jgi:hypothetical protein